MQINVKTDWKEILESQTKLEYWKQLSSLVENAYKSHVVYPEQEDIFKCFNFFNFAETKIVLIGQDPYPTPGDANGLAFSVDRSNELPPSLENIFSELKNDLNITRHDGNLTDWAKQGILLLNSALTFSRSVPNFLLLWKPFIEYLIQYIDQNLKGVIFILWGKFAKQYLPLIKNNIDYVIQSGHPSFASVHGQFFNTKPFSKTNNILKILNKTIIKW